MRAMLAGCLLAAFFVSAANAQTPIEAVCGPLEGLMRAIERNHGEVPAWAGKADRFEYILLQSPSGSWTILRRHGSVACVVDGGFDGSGKFVGGGA